MNFEKKYMEKTDVDEALKRILLEQNPYYLSMWDSLTLHQRSVLKSIAYFGGEKIFSQEFIQTSNLGSTSSLQTSLNLLMKKELVGKINGNYEISDVFFKEWIKRETA